MFSYFVVANLLSLVVLGLYHLLLRNTAAHNWNRYYLLAGTFLALTIPLVPAASLLPSPDAMWPIYSSLPAVDILATSLGIAGNNSSGVSLLYVYSAISVLLFIGFIIRAVRLWLFIRRQNFQIVDGSKVALNTGIGPASVGSLILFPASDVDPIILKHEQRHIAYFHYIDNLVFQVLLCFLFPVIPFYFIRRELMMLHEFSADAVAENSSDDYMKLLLNQHFNTNKFTMLHTFFYHPLKRRIMMLQNKNRLSVAMRAFTICGLVATVATTILFQSYSDVRAQEIRQLPDAPLRAVEEMPSFPGGRDAMMNYLKDNINYPKDAIKEGQVVAEFIVSKDGSIGDIKIIRSLDEACDAEVKRVLMAMPDWQPGKQFGEAVPVYFMLPVTFKKK
jgi:hypothetical protein